MPKKPAKLTVYYDDSCPLCRIEMEAIKEADRDDRIALRDCSPSGFRDVETTRAGLSQETLMGAMHVRDAEGRWHRGIDAFEAIYAAAGANTMARLFSHPRLRPIWLRLYPFIARYRQTLSRLGAHRLYRLFVRRVALHQKR